MKCDHTIDPSEIKVPFLGSEKGDEFFHGVVDVECPRCGMGGCIRLTPDMIQWADEGEEHDEEKDGELVCVLCGEKWEPNERGFCKCGGRWSWGQELDPFYPKPNLESQEKK